MEAVPEGTKIATVKDPATMLPGPTFAHRLILEREARGMRRDQFARELRVSSKTLHGWEDERHYPDVATLTWITRFLGWDGQRRRFAVTFLTQRIVEAESSGQALDRAWEEIERVTASPRKAVVISVKPVARRRAKVRG
jgi:transcriptional regulator with XRE-family HTH domain